MTRIGTFQKGYELEELEQMLRSVGFTEVGVLYAGDDIILYACKP